jgi:putative membrane protein
MTVFTPATFERVAEAVKAAERQTSGEIVPFVVQRSDHYHEAPWRAMAAGVVIVLLVSISVQLFTEIWIPLTPLEVALAALGLGAIGYLLAAFVNPCTRMFAGRETMSHRVHQRAGEAFLAEEVFATRERTGILLFVSLLEQRVVVLGDSGINAKVAKEDWEGIVRMIVAGMKRGQPADGLVEAIGRCGELLAQHGVARRADDTDELSDNLRMSKE